MAEQKITNWVAPNDKSGEFNRGQSQFRNWIKKGGEFPPEKGRYHLYVSYACPWAHRTLIVRKLKGLEDIIPYTSVHWHMAEKGWRFATAEDDDAPGDNVMPSPVEAHKGYTHLRDIYFLVDPEYTGRFTVPTLYDVKQGKIVSNESSEIIRMFYTEFDDIIAPEYKNVDLFPASLQKEIEATNEWTYNDINNGVYRSGFATKQEAYEKAVTQLFTSLDRVEKHLSENEGPYYFGKIITEADVRLFTTMIRFDVVYVQHFKTNIRDVRSGYPYIHKWLRHLYWNVPAFGETTEFTHIKKHYTKSHTQINPFSITPVGPDAPILREDEEVPAVKWALSKFEKLDHVPAYHNQQLLLPNPEEEEEVEAENPLEVVLRQSEPSPTGSISVGMTLDADGIHGFEFVQLELQDADSPTRCQILAIKIPESMAGQGNQSLSLNSMCSVALPSFRFKQPNRGTLQRYALKAVLNESALEPSDIEWSNQVADGQRCLGMIGIKGDGFLDKECPQRSCDISPLYQSRTEGDFRAVEPITFDPEYIEHHLVQSQGCPWTTLRKLEFFRNVAERNYIDALSRRNQLFPSSQYSVSEAEKHLVDQSLLVQSLKPLREAGEYVERRYQAWKSEVSVRLQAKADLDTLDGGH